MSATIKYKGNTIANITETANKTLKTSGKYCEADIVVENVQDGGITPTGSIDITENGTFDVTNYASALVNVASGGGISGVEMYEFSFPTATALAEIDLDFETTPDCILCLCENASVGSSTVHSFFAQFKNKGYTVSVNRGDGTTNRSFSYTCSTTDNTLSFVGSNQLNFQANARYFMFGFDSSQIGD